MAEPWREKYDVDPITGCHVWKRGRQSRGYGVVWFDGRVRLAHRVAWFLTHGAWPDAAKVIDHACENKACVNVQHLRELYNWQNLRRAFPPASDPRRERIRETNRRAQAKRRGTYSPSWRAERV